MTAFNYDIYKLDDPVGPNFNDRVIQPSLEADRYVAEIGGLPEIEQASGDLKAAIEQTRSEIEEAEFASRFAKEMTPRLREAIDTGLIGLNLFTRDAAEREGEAGIKRQELLTELRSVEGDLFSLITRLVMLRANLHISKSEF